jgi:hypothetical protein
VLVRGAFSRLLPYIAAMDEASRARQLAIIRSFCARQPVSVLFDEPGELLMDVFSSKAVPLAVSNLISVEERKKKGSADEYIALSYDDGRQMALADVGIAFAPDTRNTGKLEELPDVVCFRDYQSLLGRLKHELFAHSEREPTRATLLLLMTCLAILDGARRQGFDVGREEKELEAYLAELEKRAPRPPTIP